MIIINNNNNLFRVKYPQRVQLGEQNINLRISNMTKIKQNQVNVVFVTGKVIYQSYIFPNVSRYTRSHCSILLSLRKKRGAREEGGGGAGGH